MRRRSSSIKKRPDSWQIIYIDLMTNIMIFFVILWSINQGLKKANEAIGNESAAMVNLPGDILFQSGRATVTGEGREVFKKLFTDSTGAILNFDSDALTRRLLVIHGHTDNDGTKEKNLELGFQRALAVYREIRQHGKDLDDHIVICSHADNSPAREVPKSAGKMAPAQQAFLRESKAKNRRITIEDKIVERNTLP